MEPSYGSRTLVQGLSDCVGIVTGAASPIGTVISRRLYSDGVKLMLGDLDGPGVTALAEELGALAIEGDLSEEACTRSMIAQTIDAYGRVDILVNNAGGGVIRPFLEHDAASLNATMNRNLWTTLWACHAVLPHMVTQKYGRIVNIGADSVRNGIWQHAGYNAAKGGVHGLTTGLAREFAKDQITVNTIAPCLVGTPMVKAAEKQGNALIQEFKAVIPAGRPAECEEVASMVAYLASAEASFVTGQVISVNGGSTML